MAEDATACVSLWLEPEADSAAIEQAYKRLIKEHHPDREGGDASRAAELNRAYRELRAARDLKDPLELNEEGAEGPSSSGHSWPAFTLLALGGIAAVSLL